jgi:hypothetical protein
LADERAWLLPSKWRNQSHYLLYLTSLVPRVASLLIVAGVCAALLRRRDRHWVSMLRAALGAILICQTLSIVIDVIWFPKLSAVAIAGLVLPAVFLIYTFQSRRVEEVFSAQPPGSWQ